MNLIETAYASPEEVQETTATTEGGNESGVLASLGINGTLFVSQLINFALVALILWFLILKPLTKKMTERQKLIDDSLENAKKIQDNLQKSEQKYQERIDLAKVEANKILEKAAAETEEVTQAMKKKAKTEIELLVDQAKRNIGIEKEQMISELKNKIADIVVVALEKILAEKVTDQKDKQIIEEMVKKIK